MMNPRETLSLFGSIVIADFHRERTGFVSVDGHAMDSIAKEVGMSIGGDSDVSLDIIPEVLDEAHRLMNQHTTDRGREFAVGDDLLRMAGFGARVAALIVEDFGWHSVVMGSNTLLAAEKSGLLRSDRLSLRPEIQRIVDSVARMDSLEVTDG